MTDTEKLERVESKKEQHGANITLRTSDVFIDTHVYSSDEDTKELSERALELFKEAMKAIPKDALRKGYQ